MKRWTTLLSTLVLLAASAARGSVLLNEIMADPASDWDGDSTYSYRDDEWVEIFNAGIATVDLSAYWLSDSDSTTLFNFSGTLAPGARLIVYGSDAVAWQRANGRTVSGLRLNNTGDTVMLWKTSADSPGGPAGAVLPAGAVIVDSYSFQDHEAENDRSSGRMPDGGMTWELFDALNPYTGGRSPSGNGCTPSPGGPNGCPTPAEGVSWGSVKALYR